MIKKLPRRNLDAPGPEGFMRRIHEVRVKMPDRVIAEMSSTVLQNNFKAIQDIVPHQTILPMLKANAYGHGLAWAAKVLTHLPGLNGFGVATLEEGAELRTALGPAGRKVRIIVFSETTPWSDEVGGFCEQHGLTSMISSEADWALFSKRGWPSRIPYELHFNTGMNRLGISPSFAKVLVKDLKAKPLIIPPVGISSHLAMSEAPHAKLTELQVDKFKAVRMQFASAFPQVQYHLANSGGIWNQKSYDLKELTDVVRPGVSLYGIPPWPGAPERGISPVMTYKACVIGVHRLKPGDTIGYGGTFKVKGSEPVFAAILGAGYADGVMRALSNQGHAWLDGRGTRFLGVVSMDLSAVRCSHDTLIGTWVEIMGPRVDAWAQAQAAGTIPYELLTSVSARVKRIYDSSSE